jgi:class 3 adenylate cyclase
MTTHQGLVKHIQRDIKENTRDVTILFTDIKASAKYWHSRGDIRGRLMIDLHNRLIIPVIKQFRGRVVKKIGDSLMVSFRKPTNAMKAAIGIQQILDRERSINKDIPKIRIGLHSGKAIVEKDDIFGDTVNVASRIESKARAGQILTSARTVRKMKQRDYFLEKKGPFTPKGKSKPITLYACNWRKAPSLIENINLENQVMLSSFQRIEIFVAALVSLFMIAFLFIKYIRYLVSDLPVLSLLLLNPKQMIVDFPILAVLPVALVGLIIFLVIRLTRVPLFIFRIVIGITGFTLFFFLLYFITMLPFLKEIEPEHPVFISKHRLVEVTADNARIHADPSENARVIRTVSKGYLLLQTGYRIERTSNLVWNKVLIGRNRSGWIIRISPEKMGVPEIRYTIARRFRFLRRDLISLIGGIIGFLFAIFRFRIRPT